MTERFIYFMRPVGMDGPIKIGCSEIPEKRLLALSTWSPFPLEIVATAPGGFDLERNIHECFAELHSHREWFTAGRNLVEALVKIAAGVPVHDAIDLTVRKGKVRGPGGSGRKSTPDQKRYLSYLHKTRWAEKKASDAAGVRLVAPVKFSSIMHRWSHHYERRKPVLGVTPTTEETAYLDVVLSDPHSHFVTMEVRWPPVAA